MVFGAILCFFGFIIGLAIVYLDRIAEEHDTQLKRNAKYIQAKPLEDTDVSL